MFINRDFLLSLYFFCYCILCWYRTVQTPQGGWTAFDFNNMLHTMWNYFTTLNLKLNNIILCSFESVTQFTVVSHKKQLSDCLTKHPFGTKQASEVKSAHLSGSLLKYSCENSLCLKRDHCHLECMEVAQLHCDALHWNEMHCLVAADGTAKQVWLSSIIWWGKKLCIAFGRALNITYYRWQSHTEC